MTKRLEGDTNISSFRSLWQTLLNKQTLLARCTFECTHSSKYVSSAVAFGKEKLNTYFNLILMESDVSYYSVALTLHPKLRLT
jgi:hypothetical protein